MSYSTLLDASFKGVPFFVTSETLEKFGRRIVNHEYPNTSEQYSEDVGGFAKNFKVNGFVVGDDAQEKMIALKNACNEKGTGLLILPSAGSIIVQCGEASVTIEPYVNLEMISFEIIFYQTRNEAGFVEATDNAESVYAKADAARLIYTDKISQLYKSDSIFFGTSQVGDVKSLLSSLSQVADFAQGNDIGLVNNAISQLSSNTAALINSSKILFDNFSNLEKKGIFDVIVAALVGRGSLAAINKLVQLATTYETKLSTNITTINRSIQPDYQLTDQNKNYWDENTTNRIARNKQRMNLVDFYKLQTLSVAYALLSDTVFETSQESLLARDALEQAYINMIHGNKKDIIGSQVTSSQLDKSQIIEDTAVMQAFEQLRLSALKASESKGLILYKLETANINSSFGISCLNAAYLTQAEQIKNEEDLINLSKVMYRVNGQKAYGLTGLITVLKRIS
jgi:prophage DNA circulation protein